MEPMIMLKKMTTAILNFVLISMMLVYMKKWENGKSSYVIFRIGYLFSYDCIYTDFYHIKSKKKKQTNQVRSQGVHLWQIIGRLQNAFKLSLERMITNWH